MALTWECGRDQLCALSCLQSLVRQAEMIDTEGSDSDDDGMGEAHSRSLDNASLSGNEQLLYTRGEASSHFTLVLQVQKFSCTFFLHNLFIRFAGIGMS